MDLKIIDTKLHPSVQSSQHLPCPSKNFSPYLVHYLFFD